MKKLSATLLSIALLGILICPALAAEPGEQSQRVEFPENMVEISSFTVFEYDSYLVLKEKSDFQLLSQGYSFDEIQSIQDNVVEDELLARAQMSVEELEEYGYTQEQIAILQEYDGSPLEDSPQMRSVMSALGGTLYENEVSATTAGMAFRWTWGSTPIASLPFVNDFVTCSWRGIDAYNDNSWMRLSDATCYADYYQGSTYSYQKTVPVTVMDRQVWCKALVEQNDGSGKWPKQGWLYVNLEQENPNNPTVNTTTFHFAYGHAYLAANGGVSVGMGGLSPGVSFGLGVSDMYRGDNTMQHP